MAAPIRTVLRRSILRNILKIHRPTQNVTVAAFSDESTKEKRTIKFDLSDIDSPIQEETINEEKEVEDNRSFATLFRQSELVQMGDLKDKTVLGRIVNVIDEDLYIDFGGKFYCVCQRPAFQKELYVKGSRVKLFLHKYEMSSSFLGSDKHVTLLEADCTLLGSFHQAIRDHAEKIKSEFEEKSEETPEKTDYVDRLLSKEDIEANTEDTAFRPDS